MTELYRQNGALFVGVESVLCKLYSLQCTQHTSKVQYFSILTTGALVSISLQLPAF